MPRPRSKPWPHDLNQSASGKPGAVHCSCPIAEGFSKKNSVRLELGGVISLPAKAPAARRSMFAFCSRAATDATVLSVEGV